MYRTVVISAAAAGLVFVSAAFAEQKQDSGSTTDNAELCQTLYEVYDLNMESYYTKGQTNKQRQTAYNSAQRALSDFRKNGCKYKDVAK